jgi:hypothetical protein
MIEHYLSPASPRPARPLATRKLVEADEKAVETIGADPSNSFSHPRPYPALACHGLRRIKIHRYWIGYVPGPEPIIADILDEVSDIPSNLSADRAPIDQA